MICPECNRETSAVAQLGHGEGKPGEDPRAGGGMVRRCAFSDCGARLPTETASASPRPALAEQRPVVSGAPVVPKTPANGAPPSFASIVASAESRLLEVRTRIAELRSLETEERQLLLILSAAGKAPPASEKPS